jgi:hypothetical protein
MKSRESDGWTGQLEKVTVDDSSGMGIDWECEWPSEKGHNDFRSFSGRSGSQIALFKDCQSSQFTHVILECNVMGEIKGQFSWRIMIRYLSGNHMDLQQIWLVRMLRIMTIGPLGTMCKFPRRRFIKADLFCTIP